MNPAATIQTVENGKAIFGFAAVVKNQAGEIIGRGSGLTLEAAMLGALVQASETVPDGTEADMEIFRPCPGLN